MRYRSKLLLWIIPTLVAGLLLFSVSSYWYIRKVIKLQITRSMLDTTEKSADTIDHWLKTLLLEPETTVKILYSSGYTREIIQNKNLDEAGVNFIPKPASPAELLKKVRKILDS